MGKRVLKAGKSRILAAFVALGAGCQRPSADVEQPQPDLPALALELAPQPAEDGGPTFEAVVSGRVAVIDFWATWCRPCRDSVPKLVRLDAAYRDAGLAVVGVDVGERPATVRAFADDAGISYPLFVDPTFAFADAMQAREVPTLLIVDAQGVVVQRHRELDSAALAEIRHLLGK
jgi:thiol-disulfide isomerase/thioredoxin